MLPKVSNELVFRLSGVPVVLSIEFIYAYSLEDFIKLIFIF